MPVECITVIPYLFVIVTAIIGINVIIVLSLGIIVSGIIGVLTSAIGFFDWM